MTKAERLKYSEKLLIELESLRKEWDSTQSACSQSGSKNHEVCRRERLKTIETGTALLRLIQSEDRLLVQMAVGVLSFVSGSAITLLIKILYG